VVRWPPLKPILCKVGSEGPNRATRLLHSVSKAFCTRALSADAEGVFGKADSGGTALVLLVRAARGICAHAGAWLVEIIEEIWGADEHPFTIFTPDGLGEFLVGPVVSLGGEFINSISVCEGPGDIPCC